MIVPQSRKERERESRRKEILASARSVFSEKGYSRATLEEIAQRAEFGKGTLYNYFVGGKEELLFTVIEQMYDEVHTLITDHFESAGADQPMRPVLRALIFKILSYYENHQDTFMILVKEVQRLLINGDEKAAYFIKQRNRLIEALEAPLSQAIQSGQLRPLPPRAVANMFLGNVHGCQMHVFLDQEHGQVDNACRADKNAEFLTTMLLDGLLVSQPVAEESTQ
ncbi:MAG: TetR/AcrR family transcriptional regulator [Rhodothermales bacterium]|nr:TetR/AcrR family transcriptional regulator [Rhodothermales bacterium]